MPVTPSIPGPPNAAQQQLHEAYARLHRYGPEFGGDEEGNHGLTNHGPMAVEVLLRRGLDVDVDCWLDRYVRRLAELPRGTRPITEGTWGHALGDHHRLPDWTLWFADQLRDRPWAELLAEWWPRLLPGIVAGSTHGVIRVGHAVRALRATGPSGTAGPALRELAHGLAFWAARYRPLPGQRRPAGHLSAADALDAVPRLATQDGFIAHRVGRLATTPGWPHSLRAIRPARTVDVPARLAELVDAATRSYLVRGHGSPVLLVHTATAPNAVLHTLPVLPEPLWVPSFDAAWAAAAAITATYAPTRRAPRPDVTPAPAGDDPVTEVLHRAADHGDEHVIKFTDTAVEAYERAHDPDLLAAALRAGELITG
ncbi:questin oxidase family protein [Micromonospora sp. MS34]|uniref:questin oxidase family protein n=1 Tax=Micromonospora sp. MS34 TaxID=3385971 RepID=UPI0039A3D8B5